MAIALTKAALGVLQLPSTTKLGERSDIVNDLLHALRWYVYFIKL